MKIKIGEHYYFDVLGRTDKPEVISVVVIEKKKFGKVIVMSVQTNERFITKSKLLTPIYKSPEYIIRKVSPILEMDLVDYQSLSLIHQFLTKKCILDDKIYDFSLGCINTCLCKLSLMIKHKQLSNSIESVLDKSITELNKKIISDLNEDEDIETITDLSDNQSDFMKNVNHKINTFINELMPIIDEYGPDSEQVHRFFKNYPAIINISSHEIYLDKDGCIDKIKELANTIYENNQLGNGEGLSYIPYLLDDNTIDCKCIHSSDSEEIIYDKLYDIVSISNFNPSFVISVLLIDANIDDYEGEE